MMQQALSTGLRWWFESLDQLRRQRGTVMDRVGYGPHESAFQTILSVPGMRLRRYADELADGPVVLIVPAPIKRHYIWDMTPETSVIQHALARGMRVYLIEWIDPVTNMETRFGLEEYGYTLIGQGVAAIRAEHPHDKIMLFSHSLGGIFAAIYATICPEYISGAVLIETPLHFGKEASGSFGPLVALGPSADTVTRTFERVPGSVLNFASTASSPATFSLERYADLVASIGSPKFLKSHILVERWTLDEAPMAGRLFEQIVNGFYREDSFMRGSLTVNGQQLSPQHLTAPLLSVYDPRSVIIPPASVIAFHEAAGSTIKQLLTYDGDTGVGLSHVGALVGENAHRFLWPQIFDWVDEVSALPS
ncbi:MAG TPA: alpha/beta hydrolase [Noviherbaspirillum sp.]|nr:alpha/beta hydrolase [Noviherbaspirillum sp.]